MRALLDTGVWFRRYHRLPMSRALRQYLDEVTEFYLSPLSIAEISYKWQHGKLPEVPDPRTWLDHALENFILLDLSSEAARQPVCGLGRMGIWSIALWQPSLPRAESRLFTQTKSCAIAKASRKSGSKTPRLKAMTSFKFPQPDLQPPTVCRLPPAACRKPYASRPLSPDLRPLASCSQLFPSHFHSPFLTHYQPLATRYRGNAVCLMPQASRLRR
jgi:hypothetical protein